MLRFLPLLFLTAVPVSLLANDKEEPLLSRNSVSRPNIVLILADDMGWADLACYGSEFHETPAIDRLAEQGLRFTQAYAPSPVCTPSRAALLTGKHPARLGITIWSEGAQTPPIDRPMLPGRSAPNLPLQETTLSELLQQSGYLTALVGKWHLGDAAHAPESQGFDINIGGTHWGAPQTFFFPYRGNKRFGEFRYVPHLEFGKSGEYLTDRLTDESIRVIDHAATQKKPFFLLLSHHAPHTPIEAKEVDVSYFAAQRKPQHKQQNPAYAAMILSLDTSVNRIVSRLNELDLTNDTIVIFTSDNGGYLGHDAVQNLPITSNAPLRSGKGTLYEGGLRIPLIIRWPKLIDAEKNCDQPIVLTDLFPTLAAATGIDVSKIQPCDGINRLPLLKDPLAPQPWPTMYFHYPHYYHAPPSTPASALRSGPWKSIEYYENKQVELYNLESDPSELNDVADKFPEQTAALLQHLRQWLTSVDAQLPTPNPNYRSK